MPPKVIWGSPMTHICIFLGPNYLPHAATNTAAYRCISLFCNTFLPLGKAVLVYILHFATQPLWHSPLTIMTQQISHFDRLNWVLQMTVQFVMLIHSFLPSQPKTHHATACKHIQTQFSSYMSISTWVLPFNLTSFPLASTTVKHPSAPLLNQPHKPVCTQVTQCK